MSKNSGQIVAFPYWSDNPYLNMLYLAPRAAGWKLKTSTLLTSLLIQLDEVGAGDVVHIHWTSPIVQKADTREEAAEQLRAFQQGLDTALANGAVLVWTVHNVRPHECLYPELELELVNFLVDRAAAVHVLSKGTEIEASDYYTIPIAKIVHVPHASYSGVYDQSLSRADARNRLGLADDEKALLFFGQMRAYKGLDVLFGAVERAAALGETIVLLLAGKTKEEDLLAIEAVLPRNVRIIRDHSYIPDDSTQDWFAAADLAVFPYKNVLNSGSVFLAATYGLPTILPNQDHMLRQFRAQKWIQFYDTANEVDSLGTLIADFDMTDVSLREEATAFAEGYTPYDMSREFLKRLEAALS
ncbi:glycosyltransferase [Glaciibacter psychrotolerans]|uniref:Glycosyltransferase involved in cell wall biosynthesis n=1 Tax=Glaciibacter psychrotolerans TaxID=670054 RepID=A0A7Z0EFD8_9MICO|nr:glycosyltransferase [Leifsonia psychrotolerans]NYJ20606.1 glycosyltransferase involved in cell wall biosynthesis [Leifsonia psychrotolerans]